MSCEGLIARNVKVGYSLGCKCVPIYAHLPHVYVNACVYVPMSVFASYVRMCINVRV